MKETETTESTKGFYFTHENSPKFMCD